MITLSTVQVAELRNAYAKIDHVDPCGNAYAGICKLLNALSQDDLKMLAAANIKFISRLALNRVQKEG